MTSIDEFFHRFASESHQGLSCSGIPWDRLEATQYAGNKCCMLKYIKAEIQVNWTKQVCFPILLLPSSMLLLFLDTCCCLYYYCENVNHCHSTISSLWPFSRVACFPLVFFLHLCLECFDTVGWVSGTASSRQIIFSDVVLAWFSVWSKVQIICILSSWCHWHPIISCFIKIQNGSAFLVLACPRVSWKSGR